jgi:hypothetical protein
MNDTERLCCLRCGKDTSSQLPNWTWCDHECRTLHLLECPEEHPPTIFGTPGVCVVELRAVLAEIKLFSAELDVVEHLNHIA